jgi:hypothetical protein
MTLLDGTDLALAARILFLLRQAGDSGLDLDELLFWTAHGSLAERRPVSEEHRETVLCLLGCLRSGGLAVSDGMDRYYCAPSAAPETAS